jgi:hypothetical protein
MGSMSIRNMNYVVGTREIVMSQPSSINISEMIAVMDAYKARFGSDALRELYAAKGYNDQATIAACRDILDGHKHGLVVGGALAPLMNTSVSTGE